MTLCHVYAVIHDARKEAYIGRTFRSVEARWSEHQRSAQEGEDKLLYEAMRIEPTHFDVIECECSDSASEAEWMTRFEVEGYRLLNETGGNRYVAKTRDKDKERQTRALLAGAKPIGDGTPFLQTKPYDEVIADWKAFFELSIACSRKH
jgi:hypothetical protein